MTEHDVIQVAFTYGLFSGGFGLHAGAERIGASVIPASTGSLEKQVRIMKDFKTTALACTPSYAVAIAIRPPEVGIDPQGACRCGSGSSARSRGAKAARSAWKSSLGITALDNYGLTEVLGPGVSFECEGRGRPARQRGLLPRRDRGPANARRPAGRRPKGSSFSPPSPRKASRCCATGPATSAALARDSCPCGSTLARMSRIRGRMDDMIIMGATKIFPSQIEEIVTAETGLSPHYRIYLERHEGIDSMTVAVEPAEHRNGAEAGSPGALCDRAARRIEAVLGVTAKVVLAGRGELSRVEEGKPRRVVDTRPM